MRKTLGICLTLTLAPAPGAVAQSSSLCVGPPQGPPATAPVARTPGADPFAPRGAAARGPENRLAPGIAAASFAAVVPPEPRAFALNDLITIIVRESTQTDFESSLETEKESEFDGEISDYRTFRIIDDVEALAHYYNNRGYELIHEAREAGRPVGEYSRRESMSTQLTARIIDIKPNGTLVLEARKYIQADDETLQLVVTGTARPEDITADNAVLSSQLYDLHISKQHDGELKKTARKGILTKVFELLFNF